MNIPSYIRLLGWLACLMALLPGCATLIGKPHYSANQHLLAQQSTWQAKGKVGIKTSDDGGSAFLQWKQNQQNYSIRIYGPLGQGTLLIEGDPSGVSAQSQKLGLLTGPTPEALFYEHFGWHVPVSNLYYWIRGLPSPHSRSKNLQFDELGNTTAFKQAGWVITIKSFREAEGFRLPRKMTITRGDFKITLVFSQWQFMDIQDQADEPKSAAT